MAIWSIRHPLERQRRLEGGRGSPTGGDTDSPGRRELTWPTVLQDLVDSLASDMAFREIE